MSFLFRGHTGFFGNNHPYKKEAIEDYIQTCENLYKKCISLLPGKDPHEHLAVTLGIIWTKSGVFKECELGKLTQSREILNYTLIPACVSPSSRASVLAYKIIREDKELLSYLMKEYSKYYDECSRLAKSIWDAKRKGLLKKLYGHYNKNLENLEMLFPSNNENGRVMHSYKNNSISLHHSISL